ncbi:MAG: SagB/ThcOx family dehydrogenase [Chthoniobacteraceae bacterium]
MKIIAILLLTLSASLAFAQDIALPAPQTSGGKPLMQALAARKTSRQFSDRALPPQTLSNLLWAANGFNRPGKRTAPSARNKQEIELYVFLKEGVYLYDAKANKLLKKITGDHRPATGKQAFAANAAADIVLVGDLSLQERELAHADSGFISQNIYLFCASEDLATVVCGSIDKDALGKLLGLQGQKEALYNQCVGYPPEP